MLDKQAIIDEQIKSGHRQPLVCCDCCNKEYYLISHIVVYHMSNMNWTCKKCGKRQGVKIYD